jgi:hypothetical protein|tara:strand:- start:446 stop:562 length:117 start_codon:yes stop_codon:yes gene_type:complete
MDTWLPSVVAIVSIVLILLMPKLMFVVALVAVRLVFRP